MFDRTEWLSNMHIQGFFSRLCLKQRSKIQQESDYATDADDHLIKASASDVDEKCYADRCDDQISFFSFHLEIRAITALF